MEQKEIEIFLMMKVIKNKFDKYSFRIYYKSFSYYRIPLLQVNKEEIKQLKKFLIDIF